MANQLLYLHWKAVRWGLVPFMIAAFGLPLLAIQGTALPAGLPESARAVSGAMILQAAALWVPFFPALAALIGVTLALTSWNWDHETKHVYALSLPITRAQYTLHKLGAGASLAALPSLAFLAGGLIASGVADLPATLQAYPVALTTRFYLATLSMYALMFALAAGTLRTAITIISVAVGVLVFGGMFTQFLGTVAHSDALRDFSVAGWTFEHLFAWPSPLNIFAGNWSLIDV